MTGAAAAESRRLRPESLPYTFKTGELRVLATPSLGLDFNDNIRTVGFESQSDFILKPMLQLSMNYPVTQRNLLNLNVGVGYDQYFDHDELSAWRLNSGSELSFDILAGDFLFNLHDRFSYTQDPAQNSAVAGTAEYGNFNNSAGLLVRWDLQDVTPSLGYDHVNVIAPSGSFQSQDRATENIVGRVGLQVHPKVVAGVEATAAFTAYDQPYLNDNSAYSAGVYADWRAGTYFHVQPRFGYTIYQFQQTSQSTPGTSAAPPVQTSDLNSWYADLTVQHDFSELASYSFSIGHEIRLGVQSDANEVSYVRPSVNWRIFKQTSLQTSLFYEHGQEGVGNIAGNFTETYDWYGGALNLSRPLTKRLTLDFNYRLTFRSSDTPSREYTQNLVGLLLTYRLQ